MNIPTIYILFLAEFILVLSGLGVFYFIYKRKQKKNITEEPETEDENIDIGNTYIDFIEQELTKQDELSFKEPPPDTLDEAETSDEDSTDDSNQSEDTETTTENNKDKLLEIRSKFLTLEKNAAEASENEAEFWERIYSGIQELSDELGASEEPADINEADTEEEPRSDEDKVLYIETQGEKINGQVDQLKDIISGQEHTLSELHKALKDAEESLGEGTDAANSSEFQELLTQA